MLEPVGNGGNLFDFKCQEQKDKIWFFFKVFGMSLLIIGGCGRDIKLSVEVP